MKHKVEILPSAWEVLKRIGDYYAVQFDVETALKVSDHILDATWLGVRVSEKSKRDGCKSSYKIKKSD